MAFDAFLKLGDLAGDATDKTHAGELRVQSYAFGVANPSSVGSASGGAGAGKPTFNDLTFTTPMSVASPRLLVACASAQHFPQAILTLRRTGGGAAGPVEFCKITLSQVLVSSYQDAGASAEEVPTESVSLAFGAIKVEYTGHDANGKTGPPVTGGWDQRTNRPQ